MKGAESIMVGIPGPDLDPGSRGILARLQPGGVILFRRNIDSAERLRRLIGDLREVAPETLLAVDAEGGRVDRLAPLVGPAPAAERLAALAPRFSERAGRWVGHALAALGFDLDFAPVVDLDRGEVGNALDGRTFGREPRPVLARAGAFLRGLESSGVGGCIKHFPGLGGASADTHLRCAPVELSAEELAVDLRPFAALADRAGAVMIGHAIYPALDGERRPATLSPPITVEILRCDLGFGGLAVGDDLEMQALEAWGEIPERGEAAFASGNDLLLVCHRTEAAVPLAERLASPRFDRRRGEAGERLDRYRDRLRRLRRRGFRLETVRRRLAEIHRAVERAN